MEHYKGPHRSQERELSYSIATENSNVQSEEGTVKLHQWRLDVGFC